MNNEQQALQSTSKIAQAVMATMRLPFLVLTPACLLLAFALVYKNTNFLDWSLIILITIGALCAHIAVNMLNEYTDFTSGLDFDTQRTPFSGGSGGLVAQPGAKSWVLLIAILNLSICCVVGLYLSYLVGSELLTIGLLGVVIIITYTRWINRLPFLCLIAPGLAFGVLLVNGTYFVLTQSFQIDIVLISLLPFFLVNNLLLLNQFPDISADMQHGRKHMLIKYGVIQGANAYLIMSLGSVVTLFFLIYLQYLPYLSAVALLPLFLSIRIGAQLKECLLANQFKVPHIQLTPLMGRNVALTLVTPVLLAITIVVSFT